MGEFVQVAPSSSSPPKVQNQGNKPMAPIGGGGGGSNVNTLNISWDPARTGGSIQLTESNAHCFLKEQSYLFRTTIGNQGYMSGVHYW